MYKSVVNGIDRNSLQIMQQYKGGFTAADAETVVTSVAPARQSGHEMLNCSSTLARKHFLYQ
ncbi:hypothetical protein KCP76_14560 [Salmonella enterica subsp. enterica serovar Weltevreden]|nr:hypothetical protein KCP76_14560 [Salmonella enterica subsp. enterica serovar Weltevreden]